MTIHGIEIFIKIIIVIGVSLEVVAPEDFKWKNRLLVYVHLDKAELEAVEQQHELFREEISERQILIGRIRSKKTSFLGGSKLDEKSVKRFLAELGLEEERPVAVLIGKDGSVKFKGPYSSSLSDVFALVDSMPMRKREIAAEGP